MKTLQVSIAVGLLLSTGAALTGCAERTQNGASVAGDSAHVHVAAPPASAPPDDAEGTISNAGSYDVSYVIRPAPIPLNETFAIEFWVRPTGAAGPAAEAIEVAVDARMPHHHHGMYRVPRVKSLGGGHFEATGMLFHMPGYWEIYFDITHAGMTERAQFSVEID